MVTMPRNTYNAISHNFFMVTRTFRYGHEYTSEAITYVCKDEAMAREAADLVGQEPHGEGLVTLRVKVIRYVDNVAQSVIYQRRPSKHNKTDVNHPFWQREIVPSGLYMISTADAEEVVQLVTTNLNHAKICHDLWDGESEAVDLYEIPYNLASFEGLANVWEDFKINLRWQ